MPNFQGHLAGGAVTFALVYSVSTKLITSIPYTGKETILALIFCLLGALFPDVDTKSIGQKVFYTINLVLVTWAILTHQWSLLSILSLLGVFPMLVSHRGIIHTVWFVTLVPLCIPFVMSYNKIPTGIDMWGHTAWMIYGYFVAGALSHLLLDYGFLQTLRRMFFK